MKKLLKWTAIIIGLLVVILIIGVVALPFIVPLDKIKDLATAKISETINRKVTIEKVSFDIFSGIKLEKLSISNQKGFADKPFVSADAIALRYAFWPLFKKQVIIHEIRLVKPEILIEKSKSGVFNFSDMTQKKAPAKKKKDKDEGQDKDQDFSMIINTFSIRQAKITYVDYGTNTSTGLKDADLTISGFTLAMLKPISLDFSALANYKKKDIPISLAGKVAIDLKKGVYKIPSLDLGIAGEKANLSLTVSDLKTGPSVKFGISSKKLDIDPLLAVFTAGASVPKEKIKPVRGELTKTVNKVMKGIPGQLKVSADVNMGKVTALGFRVDKAQLGFSLKNKVATAQIKDLQLYNGSVSGTTTIDLKASGLAYNGDLIIEGFNAHPFSNDVVGTFLTKMDDHKDLLDKVYGTLDISLAFKGSGVEVPDIMANAVAAGSLSLKNGELKRLKTLDAIADKIKTPGLKQDMKITELAAEFTMKDQVVDMSKLDLKDHDINAGFKGGLDLAKLKFVSGNRLTLRASPASTKGLAKEYNLLRDKDGWLEITVELTGDLKKPIPVPVLEKALEKAVGKVKVKIEAKKVEIEEAAKEKVEEEKKRLEEEAKKKLEEEAKNQLKDLIKF
ncbi:AsmA family protein [Candidatus Margulisiibacteriota bacterium]